MDVLLPSASPTTEEVLVLLVETEDLIPVLQDVTTITTEIDLLDVEDLIPEETTTITTTEEITKNLMFQAKLPKLIFMFPTSLSPSLRKVWKNISKI